MNISEFEFTLNEWGHQRVPFLFIVDFEMQKPLAFPLSEINNEDILFYINGITNSKSLVSSYINADMVRYPISLEQYHRKFDTISQHLQHGDSYLTNLTIKTQIKFSSSFKELFQYSRAKYKLLYKDQFLVFSPEIFIQIRNGKIFSYPMKGTIDAGIADAEQIILKDKKELAEHTTIVDLIRNDLSLVATNVHVARFRYVDKINTSEKNLLQVSSEIAGDMQENFHGQLGTLLLRLLPAGSVTGAPKEKTVEIIRQAEGEDRGYYTGVFGIFDGNNFDSGVMIRFIERSGDKFFYRSGGGITTQSTAEAEYEEAINKIYVPLN